MTHDTPPTFIYQTTNDELVPPQGSLDFHTALVNAQVPAELHVFANGRTVQGWAWGMLRWTAGQRYRITGCVHEGFMNVGRRPAAETSEPL